MENRKKSVGEIRRQLDELYGECSRPVWYTQTNHPQKVSSEAEERLEETLLEYESDPRQGVRQLIERYKKKIQADRQELQRVEKLCEYEKHYAELTGFTLICGLDEAGRGPLAGPVVAGAVILPPDCRIRYVNDSKQLSAARREELYEIIREQAAACAVGVVGPDRIDEINILQATYEAMRQAIDGLGICPQVLLNDAVTIPDMEIPQVPLIKGDARSISIASASILAKVTRDRMMLEYDRMFPKYGFSSHKGYGSREHIEAIKRLGPLPIHRRTFIKNFV